MSGLDRNPSSDFDNSGSNQERDSVGELPRRAESDSSSSDTSRTSVRPLQPSISSTGGAGMSAVPVPVERQTTLVLQGYFEQNASREQADDVRSFFDSLEGSGRTTDSEETFLQLGMEINRASIQLQVRYQQDFENMMADLGDNVSQIIEGLGQIAMRLFSDPNQISWSRILTYFSFACWVIFKKALQLIVRELLSDKKQTRLVKVFSC
ncbi:uncharacterized protein LOC142334566 isoform X2 [Convolutriloba macropyga]|uniref:uncharacterized protein LOC142334566 isoform X2 n=1 Tax=Convolutriloba macropyga TaxID=536237 RepID=UPI003F51C351